MTCKCPYCGRKILMTMYQRPNPKRKLSRAATLFPRNQQCAHEYVAKESGWEICSKCNRAKR